MKSDKTVTLTGGAPLGLPSSPRFCDAPRREKTTVSSLAILDWDIHSPFDCRPREPVRVDVRARSTEGRSSLQGAILAVAPDTDPERAQQLPMEVHPDREGLVHLFGTLRPTAAGEWRVWVHLRDACGEVRTEERSLEVTSANDEPWEMGAFTKQVLSDYWRPAGGELWVGNLASLEQAARFGFDAALNLAEGLDRLVDKRALDGVDYRYLPFADGAHNPLSPTRAIDGITWLLQRLRAGRKTLVNCRAGIGRSGSLAVLAGAAEKPAVGFWEIAARVKADKDIHVHVDTDRIVADPLFHQAFGGSGRPQVGSVDIERVEITGPAVSSSQRLAAGDRATVEVRVVFEGTGMPYVGLRHDLEGYLRDAHAGEPVASWSAGDRRICSYRSAVGPAVAGRRRLTAFAAPLGRAIFEADAADRQWVDGYVDFDVSD